MLKPQGLSLLNTITCPTESPSNPWLEKYIFPWHPPYSSLAICKKTLTGGPKVVIFNE